MMSSQVRVGLPRSTAQRIAAQEQTSESDSPALGLSALAVHSSPVVERAQASHELTVDCQCLSCTPDDVSEASHELTVDCQCLSCTPDGVSKASHELTVCACLARLMM